MTSYGSTPLVPNPTPPRSIVPPRRSRLLTLFSTLAVLSLLTFTVLPYFDDSPDFSKHSIDLSDKYADFSDEYFDISDDIPVGYSDFPEETSRLSSGLSSLSSFIRRPPTCRCLKFARKPTCCLIAKTGKKRFTINPCACQCGRGSIIAKHHCRSKKPPSPTQPEHGTFNCRKCPHVARPVCCQLNGVLRDARSPCLCGCQGGVVKSSGNCPTAPSPVPSPVVEPACSDTSQCLAIYKPVCCAGSDGEESTTGNECLCKCAGGSVISEGRCPTAPPPTVAPPVVEPGCSDSSQCPKIYKPVCCEQGGTMVTTANECRCTCGSVGTVVTEGQCPTAPSTAPPVVEPACSDTSQCLAIYKPVCCAGSDGEESTTGNECFCKCAGGSVISEGRCPTAPPPTVAHRVAKSGCTYSWQCPAIYEPVCCEQGGTMMITANECECTSCSVGGTVVAEGECPTEPGAGPPGVGPRPACSDDSACPLIYVPVCCAGIHGQEITTANECICRCNGGSVISSGACSRWN